jgi:hypothetical protein
LLKFPPFSLFKLNIHNFFVCLYLQQEHLALQVLEPSQLFPVSEWEVEVTVAAAAPVVIVGQV